MILILIRKRNANEEQEVIERSRCIDYFIELFSEITHPHRYRISSWVATINIRTSLRLDRFLGTLVTFLKHLLTLFLSYLYKIYTIY